MENQSVTGTQKLKITGNTIAYALFSLVGIVYYILAKDLSEFVVFFGLGLVFDPFDQTVRWNQRPTYQKVWLIVHVTITFAAFIAMLVIGSPTINPGK